MAKFKKGDRVRTVGEVVWNGREIPAGATGTVNESGSDYPWVMFDEDEYNASSQRGNYRSEDDLELVDENVPTLADLVRAQNALLLNRVGTECTFTAGESNLTEIKPKKTIMKKLNTLVKKLLDSKTQTLLKAGLINGDLERTPTGTDALLDILFLEKMDELVTVAEERIAEEEKVNN